MATRSMKKTLDATNQQGNTNQSRSEPSGRAVRTPRAGTGGSSCRRRADTRGPRALSGRGNRPGDAPAARSTVRSSKPARAHSSKSIGARSSGGVSTATFAAAVSTMIRIRKQPKGPSKDEWVKETRCVLQWNPSPSLNKRKKRKENSALTDTKLTPGRVMLSEIGRSQQSDSRRIPLTRASETVPRVKRRGGQGCGGRGGAGYQPVGVEQDEKALRAHCAAPARGQEHRATPVPGQEHHVTPGPWPGAPSDRGPHVNAC